MRITEIINRWLPPPDIMRADGLGVDISESSIKYVGFKPNLHGDSLSLKMTAWGEVPIKEGALSRGEVKDINILAEALAEVKKITGATYVRLSLPEERVYIFETEIEEDVDRDSVRNLMEFRLEENVPLSPRDSYFDYHIFNEQTTSDTLGAVVTVAPKGIVNDYYQACTRAGLIPLSFEVEPAAMGRAVLPPQGSGSSLLLDFGKTRTGIGIVYQGVLMYTSTIDVGGDQLSSALRLVVGDKEEKEYTQIKNNEGLIKRVGDGKAYEALLPVVSTIKDEVMTRLQYWESKGYSSERAIERIVLSGGSANLRGLTDYFTKTLGIETKLAEVWQNAFDINDAVPPIDRLHSYGYATAIGLGLSSFGLWNCVDSTVANLLSPTGKKKAIRERFVHFVSIVFLASSAIFITLAVLSVPSWYALAVVKMNVENKTSQETQNERKQLSENIDLFNFTIEHLKETKRQKDFSAVVDGLDKIGGRSITISQMIFEVGKKTQIVLSGVAETRDDLSLFRDNLENDPRFSSVELPLSSLVKDIDAAFSVTLILEESI